MDRFVADDASSDVVVAASPMASSVRRGNGDHDNLYRRPPAPAPDPVDSLWFADAADPTGVEPDTSAATGPEMPAPGRPNFGPTPPSGPGPGRTSFGFSTGPISPVRATAPTEPGAPTVPRELTKLYESTRPVQEAAPVSPAWSTPAAFDPLPMRSVNAPMSPAWSTPAADPLPTRSADAPMSPAWPPPATDPLPMRSATAPVADTPAWRPDHTGSWQVDESAPPAHPGGWRPTDTGSWLTGEPPARRSDTGVRSNRDLIEPGEPRAASATEPTAPPRLTETLPPRQPRIVTIGIAALSGIVLLAGTIIGVVYFAGSDDSLDSVLKLGATPSDSRAVSAPLDNRSQASFELLAGANVVNVRIGELGDDLYRISTPDDAGIRPSPVLRADALQLQVTQDGDGTGGEIDVVLAAKVTWSLRFSGYVQEERVDVTDGQISAIDMVGAAKHAELLLPKPSGTVPIKVAGAVENLTVQSPAGSPVRIQVGGGVQTVVAGTKTLRDVAPGSTLTPKDWTATNRYDVSTASRVTALTVQSVED